MKRKVIRQGHNTLTITLPSKWAKNQNIKVGDEIYIEERGTNLVIGGGQGVYFGKIEIDISDLDYSSLRRQIRSAYKLGYDEIRVIFGNEETYEFKNKKTWKTVDAVYKEVGMLIGMEIIEQSKSYCLLKDVCPSSTNEFEPIIRRIFLLLDDSMVDLLNSIKNYNEGILQNLQKKHDNLTNFINYCLRLLNKQGYTDYRKTAALYHFIDGLDMVADIIKYLGRDCLIYQNKNPKRNFLNLIESVYEDYKNFYKLYYKYDKNLIKELNERRHIYMDKLIELTKSLKQSEIILATKFEYILHVLFDITDSIICMTF